MNGIQPYFQKKSIILLEPALRGVPTTGGVEGSIDRGALPVLTAGHVLAGKGGILALPSLNQAEALVQDVNALLELAGSNERALFLPEADNPKREVALVNSSERSRILHLLQEQSGFIIGSAVAVATPTPCRKSYQAGCLRLKPGDEIQPKALVDRLIDLDYDNEVQVRIPGEFSWRGGILDLFSPAHDSPIRLDFFGDELDEIRSFAPENQRSNEHLDSCLIVPRGDRLHDDTAEGTLAQWLPDDASLLIWEPENCAAHVNRFSNTESNTRWDSLIEQFSSRLTMVSERFGQESSIIPVFGLDPLATRLLPLENATGEHATPFRSTIERWQNDGYVVAFSSANARRRERVMDTHPEAELAVYPHRLGEGLIFPKERLVLLSEKELFGRATPAPRRNAHQFHADFLLHSGVELCPGDLAVHAGYGICRFIGLQEQTFEERKQEVMVLEFADDNRIYVSLERSYLVSRYVGAGKKMPKLSKISGGRWKKAKEQAEQSAQDMAGELLRIQAVRNASGGACAELTGTSQSLYDSFEAAFPFRETKDQQSAIDAVHEDLSSNKPMDRLLCGDVGFGKTEIAMRAACQIALSGRQVAVVAPTTVLVQQHFLNFEERFEDFPITVAALSRFQTPKQQREVLQSLRTGGVDIIIGTHRLLSFDVHFQDLGLVVVDEEQRFGVRHKERLKKMRANVNVLTMTATPIPRTLHFAMAGLRSLSTIMTPPESRLPVLTTVAEEDDELVRHAIERELQRDGQVYYLHNRVQTIEKAATHISKLVRSAQVDVAHGQMHEDELEAAMLRFISGKTQVLVCTTIVESGMDIPNANTIIMDRADRFGLSQLYQLRGRVGRDIHQAYALLLVKRHGVLEDAARERLSAIRKYTHLGSGFKLAIRDLELRGAGNLLGSEQSGHIEAVGLEMYSKLLRAAVDAMKNREPTTSPQVPVMLDFIIMGVPKDPAEPSACLLESYVAEQDLRVDCARRLAMLTTVEQVDQFEEELADRFGAPPQPVQNLLQVHRIRSLACERGIQSINVRQDRVQAHGPRGIIRLPSGRAPQLQPGGTAESRLAQLLSCITALPPVR